MGIQGMKKFLPFALLAMILGAATLDVSSCGSFGKKKFGNGEVAEESPLKPIGPAPDVTFKGLDGKDVSLASLRGKVVIVNFWATWCEPCRIEIPWMIDFQKKYADRGFTVLGVAMDDEGASVVSPFVEKERFDVDGQSLPMNYPIMLGNDDLSEKFGGVFGLPTSYVISREGQIAQRIIGLVNYDHIDKTIQKLL